MVNGPNGEWKRYAFGNSFKYNEGKLLRIDRGGSGTLETVVNSYDLSLIDQVYPASFGHSQKSHESYATTFHRPLVKRVTTRQGENFTWQIETCNGKYCTTEFAHPTRVRKYSTLGFSRIEATAYHEDRAAWVIGQPRSTTCIAGVPVSLACDGDVVSRTDYNAQSRPYRQYAFGKLQHTLAYNADGTFKSYTNGRGYTTVVSNWYRGVPGGIAYPDGTSQSAMVNPDGTIASVTDENGYTTGYSYDAMGRLIRVDYPVGGTVAWNDTTQAFVQVAGSEYGLGAGHWRQTVQTGDGVKVVYFDALWRPVLTREYDAGDVSGTQRFVRRAFDHDGRTTFQSYPSQSSAPTTGIWSHYDALGRIKSVSQDSELGLLITTTEYLDAFITRVTDPRNHASTSAYMAFDQPTTNWPLAIIHPEGVHTTITRDVFGKPLSLARTDAAGVGQVRSFTYDTHQRLCKRVEPETGATLMGYDAAGNLAWSASGLPADTTCDLEGDAAPILARKATRSYDPRNRLLTLHFTDGRGDQSWRYTADGLPLEIVTHNENDAGHSVAVNAYTYNNRRLPTGESLSQSDVPGTLAIGYGYNANGFLANHNYAGLRVEYAPNALGQPTRAGSYATNVGYHPNGALKQFTYGNGIVHTMTRNARGLPEHSRDAYGSSETLDDYYDYDANGNVLAISDGLAGQNGNRDMTYDGLNRLLTTTSPMFGGTASYSYDALDNLLSVQMPSIQTPSGQIPARNHSYCYNGSNRLTNVKTGGCGGATVIGLGYDLQGNLANKNGFTYDFDYGNRLRGVDFSDTTVETYRYDGHGRRIQATDAAGDSIYSFYGRDGVLRYQADYRKGEATSYIYLAGSLIARVRGTASSAVPTLSAPASSTSGDYTVSWNAIAGATAYRLDESLDGGAWVQRSNSVATSWNATNKVAGNYRYRIRACSIECSVYSAIVTVVVQRPQSAPSISLAAQDNDGDYTVSWSAVAAATAYRLQESVNGGSWAALQDSASRSRALTGKPAGSYAYRVTACNDVGCGPVSASKAVQVVYPPTAAPALSVPSADNNGDYPVDWGSVATATSYRVYERVDTGSWTRIYNGASSGSLTRSGKGNGSYSYYAEACNAGGCGPNSSVRAVVVTHPPASAPSLSAPTYDGDGDYLVDWGGVATATRYRLYERVNGGSWSLIYQGSAGSRTLSNKADGSSYEYYVDACNAGGCGANSAVREVQVVFPPSTIPNLNVPPGVSNGDYTISWGLGGGATRFELSEGVNGGNLQLIYNGSGHSKALANKPDGSYRYIIRGCNAGGCGPGSVAKTVQVVNRPASAPALSVPGSDNNGSYVVNWGAVSTATSYRVYERVGSGGWTRIYNGASSASLTRSGKGNGSYSYYAEACNAGGCGANSSVRAVLVTHPPGAPALSVPGSDNNGSYSVNWGAVSTATSYRVYERVGSGSWSRIYNGASSASLTRSGKGNGSYSYYAEACNAGGCGANSSVRTVAVTHPPASAPSLSVPATDNNGNYVIDWGGVGTATHYRVYERVNGGGWSRIYQGGAGSLTRSGRGNGSYSYFVDACNAGGCGPNSSVRTVMVTHPPASAPSLSVPATDNNGNYVIDWGGVSTATRYRVYERVNGGGWTRIYQGGAGSLTRSGRGNGSYSYFVDACNTGGCGANSSVRTVVVTHPPGAPALSVPGSDNNGSYVVNWGAVSTATSYRVYERVGSGSWTRIYNGASSASLTRSGKGNGSYSYYAEACNAGGCGANSSVRTVLVTHPPGAPSLSVPGSDNNGSYSVNWGAVSTATSYRVYERVGSGSWSRIYNGASSASLTRSGKGNGSYSYYAEACNAGGCGANSSVRTVAVTHPPASAPSLSVPATDNNGNYVIDWGGVGTATHYRVYERVNGGGWTRIYQGGAGSLTRSGRGNGTYSYFVDACNAGGCGPNSSVRTVVVTHPPGSAPALSVPSLDNNGSYTVSWGAVGGTSKYRLYERYNGGGWSSIYSGMSRSVGRAGRAAGQWTYLVRACNAGGCGPDAVKTVQVVYPPSSAPSLTGPATSNFSGSYTVTWSGVSGASRYELRERRGTANWTVIYNAGGTSKARIDRASADWGYIVRACNAGGCGPYSAVRTISVRPSGTPGRPNVFGFNNFSCNVSWAGSSGATSYQLRRGSSTVYTGANASVRLTSGCGYAGYTVRACSAVGCSNWSLPGYNQGGGGGIPLSTQPVEVTQ